MFALSPAQISRVSNRTGILSKTVRSVTTTLSHPKIEGKVS